MRPFIAKKIEQQEDGRWAVLLHLREKTADFVPPRYANLRNDYIFDTDYFRNREEIIKWLTENSVEVDEIYRWGTLVFKEQTDALMTYLAFK